MSEAVQVVLQSLATRQATSDGVVVLALDGHSAAGKSTLAARLAEQCDAAVLHMDDFYRDEPEVVRAGYDAAGGVARYFDYQRLIGEALIPLRRRVAARFRPYDWQSGGGLGSEVTAQPAPVVIVEGVYSAHPEVRGYVDLRVLVEASEPARAARQRSRHAPHEWEARWAAAERLYFSSISPPSEFDEVVSGDG